MKDMKIYILGIFIVLFSLPYLSQTYDYVEKKVDPNRQLFDVYGNSVDIEGGFAVVGVILDDEDALEQNYIDSAGSVTVFQKNNSGVWVFYQKLVAPDRVQGALFGTAVKINEGQIIVSAAEDHTDLLGNNYIYRTGSVYVYELVGTVWTFTQKIIASDRGHVKSYFGWSLDVDGSHMLVGAKGDSLEADGVTLTTDGGSAYFYEKAPSGTWSFVQKVVNSDRNSGDDFGFSVGITQGGRAIVGAPQQDLNVAGANIGPNSGAAYLYEKVGASWTFVEKKVLPSGGPFDEYGFAVAIEGDRAVVGAPRHNVGTQVIGKIHVLERASATSWNSLGTRVSNLSTNLSLGAFGGALEMEGDKLFVGAPAESVGFTFVKGNVYLYYESPTGVAGYDAGLGIVPLSHNRPEVIYGNAIAVSGGELIVGAIGDMTDENVANQIANTNADTDSIGAVHFFSQCIHADVPQIAPLNASICEGDSVRLVISSNSDLNSAREWYWYTGPYATGTLIDSTDTIWVSPTVTTTYSVAGEGNCVGANASDSVRTYVVTVNSKPVVTASSAPGTTVCSGENVTLTGGGASTYVWDNSITDGVGFIPSGIGTTTYKVIGTDVNGCVDSTTIDVTVSNSITVGINYTGNNTICSGTPITLSGTGATSYSWSPTIPDGTPFTPLVTNTYTVTGTSASGCTDTEDITITVIAGPSIVPNAGVTSVCEGESVTISATGADSYVWTGIGAGQSQNVTPLVTTTYVVTGTQASTMCTDVDSVEITVNPLPTVVATAQPNDSLCLGESLTLVSGAPNPVWNNGVFENIVFIPTLGSVDYIVTSTDVNGCVNKDTVNVKVFSLPVVSASVSSPGAICSGDLVTLNGFGALSYVWDSSGVDIGILNGIPFMPSSGMNVFTVTGTDVNGCVGTATQSLTVNESPSVSAFSSAGGLALCDGESVSLTATGNGQSYSWNNGVTDGVNFEPPVGSTLYVVTATSANQCTSTAGITLVVNEQEDATIAPVLPLCGGVPIETLSTVTSGGVWQGVGVNALTGEFDASVAGQGIHQIIYTTSGACDDADTISIEVYPELIVNTYGDSVCFGDQDGDISVEVIQGLAPYTYLWDNDETTSAISGLGEGIYSIEVKDGNNCIVNLNIDVLLTESCDYHVFLPNVFSPNGDGSNDVFYARGKGFESLILVVYDRWGNKLFETTDKYLGWDGIKNGKPVDAGVYVYYVKAEYYDGTEEIIEGNICVAY